MKAGYCVIIPYSSGQLFLHDCKNSDRCRKKSHNPLFMGQLFYMAGTLGVTYSETRSQSLTHQNKYSYEI